MPRVKVSHKRASASPFWKPSPRSTLLHFRTPPEPISFETVYQRKSAQELKKRASAEDQSHLEAWWEERRPSPSPSEITFISVRCSLVIGAVENWVQQRLKKEAAAARASRKARRGSPADSEYVGSVARVSAPSTYTTSGTSRGSSRTLRSTSVIPEGATSVALDVAALALPVVRERRKRRTQEEMKAFGQWYVAIWSVRKETPTDAECQRYAEGGDRDWIKVKADCKKYHDKFLRQHLARI